MLATLRKNLETKYKATIDSGIRKCYEYRSVACFVRRIKNDYKSTDLYLKVEDHHDKNEE